MNLDDPKNWLARLVKANCHLEILLKLPHELDSGIPIYWYPFAPRVFAGFALEPKQAEAVASQERHTAWAYASFFAFQDGDWFYVFRAKFEPQELVLLAHAPIERIEFIEKPQEIWQRAAVCAVCDECKIEPQIQVFYKHADPVCIHAECFTKLIGPLRKPLKFIKHGVVGEGKRQHEDSEVQA